MNKFITVIAGICLIFAVFILFSSEEEAVSEEESRVIELKAPRLKGNLSVEEAIYSRVSTRSFSPKPLQKDDVGQLLWSAVGRTVHGVTGPTRAYPSGARSHPLKAYVFVRNVEALPAGLYYYNWEAHSLKLLLEGDLTEPLIEACRNPRMIGAASVNIVLTGDLSRVERLGAERGRIYMSMDVGAAGQNIHLQAETLNLGTVIIGAFQNNPLRELMRLDENEITLYVMPVGHFIESE